MPGGVLMLDGLIALDAIHLNEAEAAARGRKTEPAAQPVRKFLEVARQSA